MDEYPEIPAGLPLAPPELYRLQDVVGPEHCFGIVRVGGRTLGLSHDDHPDLWDVVYDMTGEPPWEVIHRDELFDEILEWVAQLEDPSERRDDGQVCSVLVNRTTIDVAVARNGTYLVTRVNFDTGEPDEHPYNCPTLLCVFDDAMEEARLG